MRIQDEGGEKTIAPVNSGHEGRAVNTDRILTGGGETGKLISLKDWSKNPLGPIESWPQSLLTTLSLCLASNFPASIIWGKEHVQLYNDGYIPVYGAHHPQSIGQDFRKGWASAWQDIGRAYESAWAGSSAMVENVRTFISRNGQLEEAFFSFSFTPVRDETGEVGGVFHQLTEKTGEMLSDRHPRALDRPASGAGQEEAFEEAIEESLRSLPAQESQTPDAARSETPYLEKIWHGAKAGEKRRARIVLAGDHADMREYVHRLLAPYCDVEAVKDGPAALAAARRKETDLVLSDIMMPGLDGFGLLEAIRKEPALQYIPVILLSARAGEKARVEGLRAGADDYLARPFSAGELLARVKNHLDLYRVRQEARENARQNEKQLHALAEASLAIAAAPDLHTALREITERARKIIEAHQSITSMTQGGDWSQSVSSVSLSDKYARWRDYAEVTDGSGIYAQVCRLNQPMRMTKEELEAHPMWKGFGRYAKGHPPMRGWLAVPLVSKDGSNLGLIQLSDKYEGEFTAADEAILKQFALFAATAIEKAQVEKAVRENEERFSNIFNQSSIGIAQADLNGRFVLVNDRYCEIAGRSKEELYRMRMQDITHPDDLEKNMALFEKAIKEGAPFKIEKRYIRPDASEVYVNNTVSLIKDQNGRPRFITAISQDITKRKQAEEALKYQTYLMQSITDNATAGLFMMDVNGICTFMNPAAEEISGYSFDEIKQYPQKPLHDWVHYLYPDSTPFPMEECPIDRALPENNDIRAHEDVFVRRDGSFYNVSCAARPIIKDGLPVGTLVEVRDITERKKAEQALQESEEHFRNFANNIQNLAWIAKPDGWIFWYNQQWYDYTGTTLEEMRGWDWKKVHHPDHIERVVNFVKKAWGKAEAWELTFPLRGADGKYCWFLTRAYPVKDAEGNVLRWIGTSTNIDEQKRAEEALRQSEEQFRLMADTMPIVVWTAKPNGETDYYNQKWYQYTGQKPGSGEDQHWQSILYPDDVPKAVQLWNESLLTGNLFQTEYRWQRASDGAYRWQLARALPIRNEEGEIIKWVGTATDIHDQKMVSEQLELKNTQLVRINNDLDNFVYTASHDLKAPIVNVEGLVSLLNRSLTEENNTNGKVKSLIGMIHQSIDRFKNTIEDLTDIAKVQSDGQEDLSEIFLAEMLEEVKLNIKSLIDESDAYITEDFSQVPHIYFSKKNLRSILYNLLSNAIKYRSPDRPVNVRVTSSRPDDTHILLSVQDNGIGIKEEDKPKVFMMFKRLHQHVEGTGIGMSIVKRIVDNNGGKVEIESEVGKGTTFKVLLKSHNY